MQMDNLERNHGQVAMPAWEASKEGGMRLMCAVNGLFVGPAIIAQGTHELAVNPGPVVEGRPRMSQSWFLGPWGASGA